MIVSDRDSNPAPPVCTSAENACARALSDEPAFFWWEIVEVLRRFVLIGIFVNFPAKSGTIQQITFGVLFSLLYALLQLYAQPYMVQSDDFLAAGLSTGLAVFFITAALYKFGELTDISEINSLLSDTQKNTFVPPYLLLTFVIFISISTGFIMLGFITAIQVETERKRRLLEAAKQRFPTTKWHLADGQKFACFLSHYKIEAGAEARYLHETLNAIMDGGDQMHDAAYLDSADLADLRELFTVGIGKSEVLVLLLTDGLLTRPWCLLEIREAVVMQKPIVLLKLTTGNSFSFEESRTLMGNIATEMPKRNKWCLPELSKHLGDWSLNDMAATVLRVINEGEESAVGLNINGTANQLCAQALNLVERLAAVTDRPPVEWIRPEKRKVKRSKVKATKRQPTKRGEASLAIDEASRGKKSRGLAPGGLLSRVNLRATASDSAGYGFYIVNDSQVEPLAKRLQEAISSELRTIVCHDGDAATAEGGVDGCLRRIQMSEVVLLVQTEHVLSDPYALLHLYCALCSDLPIVCVNVEGGGYDFQDAGTYLGALATRLDEKNPGGLAKLTGLLHDCRLQLGGGDGEERTVDALQHQLADTIPHTISVVFDPKAGPNDLVGTVLDIQDKAALLIRNLKAKKANAAKAAKVAKAKAKASTTTPKPVSADPEAQTEESRMGQAAASAFASAPAATKSVELVRTPIGLGLTVDSHYKVLAIAKGSQAKRSRGIAVGDQLVAINDVPLSGGGSFDEQLGAIALGTKVRLVISKPAGSAKTSRIWGQLQKRSSR